MGRRKQEVIDFLVEENRGLMEQLGGLSLPKSTYCLCLACRALRNAGPTCEVAEMTQSSRATWA
jgi:hypothetical protein